MKRLSAIIIVMMFIVAIPTETFAVSKPSQVKNLKASAKTTSSITLKWKKVKAAKGYEVQQYNPKTKKWKTLKKVKVLNYKHTKLKANTLYKYRVRAYKAYKQYYNSKTKKWQNKKPAKKNWKNKKTRTKYVYGKASKALSVRTKKKTTTSNTGSTSTSDGSTSHTHSWGSWTKVDNTNHKRTCTKDPSHVETKTHSWNNGVITKEPTTTSTGIKTYTCSVCNGTKTETIPKNDVSQIDPYSVPLDYWQGMSNDGFKKGDVLPPMTDYLGNTRTFTKTTSTGWTTETDYVTMKLINKTLLQCNKDINGEWEQGGHTMLNHSGATFDLTTFSGYDGKVEGNMSDGGDCSHGYAFTVYNLDPNKLQVIPKDASIEAVNTYSIDRNPIPETHYYYVKNGYRISKAPGANTSFVYYKKGNGSEYAVVIPFHCSPNGIGWGVGFKLMTINFEIKYDEKTIGTITADPREANYQDKSKIKLNEPDPVRKKCIEIVNNAFEDNPMTFDIDVDMNTLITYIENTYEPEECIYDESGKRLFYMNCAGGALCLETYAIKYQGEYGFATPRGGTSDAHRSFSINSNPNKYWSAQGRK